MDPVAKASVDVELHPVGEGQGHRLGEAPVEPRSPLGVRSGRTMGGQHIQGPFQVVGTHEEVHIGERPQSRIELVQVGDGRTLDDPEVDASGLGEPTRSSHQALLQQEAPRELRPVHPH